MSEEHRNDLPGPEGAGENPNNRKAEQSWLRRNLVTVLLVAIFAVGVVLLLYPSVANYWNSFRQSKAVMSYLSELEEIDTTEINACIARAREYNARIAKRGINWLMNDAEREAYQSELNLAKNGMMGYIEIESINLVLPLYHGTDENVLQIAVGHLESTSLPVGAATFDDEKGYVTDPEDGAHCIVSGHRGLPSARLFTDLDQLIEGDTFGLNIYNNVFVYEIDQIRVVEPTDMSELQIVPGQDYCTLVTCTPYGINTHRLLIRGRRIGSEDAEKYIYRIQPNAVQIKPAIVAPLIAAPILLILFIWAMVSPGLRKKRQARKRDRKNNSQSEQQ